MNNAVYFYGEFPQVFDDRMRVQEFFPQPLRENHSPTLPTFATHVKRLYQQVDGMACCAQTRPAMEEH